MALRKKNEAVSPLVYPIKFQNNDNNADIEVRCYEILAKLVIRDDG